MTAGSLGAVLACGLVTLMTAGCATGSVPVKDSPADIAGSYATARDTVSWLDPASAGSVDSSPPSVIIAGRAPGSLWYELVQDGAATVVYHAAGRGDEKWVLGSDPASLAPSGKSAMALASDGSVWYGANLQVTHFRPGEVTFDHISIPRLSVNVDTQAPRPQSLQGLEAVDELAVSKDGRYLAVSVDGAAQLVLVDTTTATLGAVVDTPAKAQAHDVAFTGNKQLVMALDDYRTHKQDLIGLVADDGSGAVTTVPVPDSSSVSATGNDILVGDYLPSLLSVQGVLSTLTTGLLSSGEAGTRPPRRRSVP